MTTKKKTTKKTPIKTATAAKKTPAQSKQAPPSQTQSEKAMAEAKAEAGPLQVASRGPAAPVPLTQRIAAVMEEVKYLQYDKDVTYGGTNYQAVTHDMVTAALRPAMLKYGIIPQVLIENHSYNAEQKLTMIQITLLLRSAVNPDDFLAYGAVGHGQDYGDKGPGKALSYAVKYAYLKAFMLETGEEEEARVVITAGPISDDQKIILEDLMDATASEEEAIVNYINAEKDLELTSVAELPQKFFPLLRGMLEAKKERMDAKE